MDGDIGAMLESVLSDPEQMKKITQMAQNLMGSAPLPEPEEPRRQESGGQQQETNGLGGIAALLGNAFGGSRPKSRSTQLLLAMRPYMRPEKQEKLDRAIKITEIVHIAGAVMKQYGGDFFGSI